MQFNIAPHQGSLYTDEDRRSAVAHYLLTGSVAAVSRATDIPERTLRHWMGTDWWAQMLAELGREKGTEIETRLTRIIDKALAEIEDRLEHGDYTRGRGNQAQRAPLRAQDLIGIARLALEQRERVRTTMAVAMQPPSPRLDLLAEALTMLGAMSRLEARC